MAAAASCAAGSSARGSRCKGGARVVRIAVLVVSAALVVKLAVDLR